MNMSQQRTRSSHRTKSNLTASLMSILRRSQTKAQSRRLSQTTAQAKRLSQTTAQAKRLSHMTALAGHTKSQWTFNPNGSSKGKIRLQRPMLWKRVHGGIMKILLILMSVVSTIAAMPCPARLIGTSKMRSCMQIQEESISTLTFSASNKKMAFVKCSIILCMDKNILKLESGNGKRP